MNFFAHAWVARHLRREPAFLLGAMLPDFATMCRARLGEITHETLAGGIAEHHATDEAFHAGETFVRVCREIAARLEARGLGSGASRAVAHVGTELLLDGELCQDSEAAGDYLHAISEAAQNRSGTHMHFTDAEGALRFRGLHSRLLEHGTPVRYRDPAFVSEILVRILAARPRLAIAAEHRAVLDEEVALLQQRVQRDRHALVHETLVALGRSRA